MTEDFRNGTGRQMSKRSRALFDRFQNFFLAAWLMMMAEAAVIVVVVLVTHPSAASPYFYVPEILIVLTLIVFNVKAATIAIPFFRSLAEDRRRRRRGLPLDP